MKMPPALELAMNHVRQRHPDVTKVEFDEDGCWLYMTTTGEAPDFDASDIDVGVLEDAAHEVGNTVGFPAKFEIIQ